mmetsp:Transcript_19257/g.27564  ORF Transcript_19257/g.27564 Transcript_19257/m.27564 type:complete len:248 (+) Transcript_19257:713-1456(+)
MAIKLLVAKMITTDFYLTLDADVILLRPFDLSYIIHQSSNRAIYRYESRSVHEHWWRGSESFLKIRNFPSSSQSMIGFGVTPAVLSTFGSLLALGRIQQLYCPVNIASNSTSEFHIAVDSDPFLINSEVNNTMTWKDYTCSAYLDHWLNNFGHHDNVWSEYTIYRLTLEYYEVFHHLHVNEDEYIPSISSSPTRLHCHDVWFADAPPWDPFLAASSGCLFSVVQSTARVSVSKLLQACRSAGLCPLS